MKNKKTPSVKTLLKKIEGLECELNNEQCLSQKYGREAEYNKQRVHDLNGELMKFRNQEGMAMGKSEARREVVQTALERAHRELLTVKPQEGSIAVLQRVLGSAQGAIALALDCQLSQGHMRTPAVHPYPDEQRREREENEMMLRGRR